MTVIIDRYRHEDRAAVDSLFRRVHGDAPAESYLSRWRWQYERNPNLPDGLPLIWLVRMDGDVIGQYATMPVRLMVNGTEIDAAWGMDVMITPDHQRMGLGRIMFDTWDKGVGASIGLGLTDASAGLFKKMQWPDMGRVPRLVKPMSSRVQDEPPTSGSLPARMSHAVRNLATRMRPIGGDVRRVTHFDDSATRLWERVGRKFAFAVRRDAAYLNWKFVETAHLAYDIATLVEDGEMQGYVVIRHVEQLGWRATILADFMVDPGQPEAFRARLRWVDREAIAARSDIIRVFTTHAGFATTLRQAGYLDRPPVMRFVAQINAVEVSPGYYDSFAQWHVTVGDSDSDR